jgi:N-acetylmuramoyl-L-alanine amidase
LFEDEPLIPSRKFAAVLLAIVASAATAAFYLRAQTQGQTSNPRQAQSSAASQMDRDLVVLDPAHGGQDAGATLGDKIYEKDVTLAIAARLRATLTAAGFTVVATRDSDSVDPNPMTYDQRAEIANRAHALACLVIHATASGPGVHLYTSALQPPEEDSSSNLPLTPRVAFVPVPWEMAQTASVSQSLRLASDLSAALGKANLPVVSGREPVRPLDNLECPAVAIELAPLPVAGSDATPVTDAEYQQRVAATLTAALQAWRDHADPTAPNTTATGAGGATIDPAAQAAAEARAAAEAAGRAAAKAHTLLGVPAGSQVRSQAGSHGAANKDKANSAGKAAPADSSSGSGDNPAPAGGTP